MKTIRPAKRRGFTIVELLIVIVVIAILATIATVAYSGIQQRARKVKLQAAMVNIHEQIQIYNAVNGYYPVTTANRLMSGRLDVEQTARTDSNCSGGTKQTDWIPDLDISLPQSDPAVRGAQGNGACYVYVSDGESYILSAWNMAESPETGSMYRRLGVREPWQSTQIYFCNGNNIGGRRSGTYVVGEDHYKYSYTFSNITNCNETPPPGA